MKDEQLEQLIEALTIRKQGGQIADSISKIGIAVCTAGILWVAGQITVLDKNVAVVIQSQIDMREDVNRLNAFANEPRFTEKNFDQRAAPITQRIDMNENTISSLKSEMKDIRNELRLIGADVSEIRRSVK